MMMERKRKLHHTTSSTSNNNNNNNHDDVDYISSVTPRQDMMPTRNDALPHHSFSSSTHRLGRRMGLLVTTQVLLILLSTQHVMVHYSGETEQHFHYWQDDSDSDMVDTHNHHDNIDNDNACRRFFRPVENATWLFAKPPIHSNAATTNNNSLVVPPPVIRQSLPTRCGRLRRPWWNMIRQRSAKQQSSSFKSSSFKSSSFKSSSVSSLFEEIAAFQSNCSAPVMRFELDNSFGLGSHLVLWSQALCNAWEKGHRLVTTMNAENEQWLWRDEAQCGSKNNKNENDGSSFHHHHHHESPWECYFARVELPAAAAAACPLPTGAYQQDNTAQHTSNRTTTTTTTFSPSVPDPRDPKRFCAPLRRTNNSNNKNTTSSSSSSSSLFLRHYRAQAFAHLFRHITPTVLREAERQVGLLFASNDSHARNHGGVVVPHDCIAVHIRWGDKFWEMDLVDIPEYIEAIQQILNNRRERQQQKQVHIYVSTEDPKAAHAFVAAVRANETTRHWRIALDVTLDELTPYRPTKGNRASWTTRHTHGRAGLVAVGSLLVALEARDLVVTTKSNWSRLWVALHQELLGLQDDGIIVDLRPGDW